MLKIFWAFKNFTTFAAVKSNINLKNNCLLYTITQ